MLYEETINATEISHIVIQINKAENDLVPWSHSSQLRRKRADGTLSV
jgi:hypothetical protein